MRISEGKYDVEMGINSSSVAQLRENEHLTRLSGKTAISENDPFWNSMLSFNLQAPRSRSEQVQLEEITDAHCKALVDNNQHTGNFTSLLKVFLSRANELKTSAECQDKIFTWQTRNILFIIRQVCKFLVENMSEDNMLEQFEARSLQDRQKDLESGAVLGGAVSVNYLDQFVLALQDITINVPLLDFNYSLHTEAVTSMIVLLSVQIFLQGPSLHGAFVRRIMHKITANQENDYIKALLQNYIEQKPNPDQQNQTEGGSIVLGLASSVANGLWSVLGRKPINGENESTNTFSTLAHQSALLLLVLTNHSCKNARSEEEKINLYQDALQKFRHVQGSTIMNQNVAPSFHLNLSRLFQTLCNTQSQETSTLLLYFLLHKNCEVRTFVLSKTDVDTLVIPILKILYSAPEQNSHHIYMALIVLLMLTEDDHFNRSVHELEIKCVDWYTDRLLSDATLGDLTILVIVRTIQYNMSRMRDRYLHTNCLAALANMSSQFKNLHSYACQRIFSLFSLLAKKQKKTAEKLTARRNAPGKMEPDDLNQVQLDMDGNPDYASELAVLTEVIRMLLEILNSCLTGPGLRHNINLVYALLHQREIFQQFQKHPGFHDVLQNIDTIISFFSGRMDQYNHQAMTIEEVHEIIKEAMLQLPSHRLKKFPELKFRYVEEDSPEEFFVPYVWSLVFNKSNVFWNPGCVQLFSLEG